MTVPGPPARQQPADAQGSAGPHYDRGPGWAFALVIFTGWFGAAIVTVHKYASRRRYSLGKFWLIAAAPVIVGGALLLILALTTSGTSTAGPGGLRASAPTSSASPRGQQIALPAYGVGRVPASARLSTDGQLEIDGAALPPLSAGQTYEVWLTDPRRTTFIPLGPLSGAQGTYRISPAQRRSYPEVEVSVQRTGQDQYSGVSVLRGSLR